MSMFSPNLDTICPFHRWAKGASVGKGMAKDPALISTGAVFESRPGGAMSLSCPHQLARHPASHSPSSHPPLHCRKKVEVPAGMRSHRGLAPNPKLFLVPTAASGPRKKEKRLLPVPQRLEETGRARPPPPPRAGALEPRPGRKELGARSYFCRLNIPQSCIPPAPPAGAGQRRTHRSWGPSTGPEAMTGGHLGPLHPVSLQPRGLSLFQAPGMCGVVAATPAQGDPWCASPPGPSCRHPKSQ